jgi:hypothetical protein
MPIKKKPEPVKKPAPRGAKKGASRVKGAVPQSAARDELLKLLPELDEEGIEFLLEQAKVHRYNMEAEKLNALAERLESGGPGAGKAGAHPAAESAALRIERSSDGSTYNLVAGGDWKLFTAEEMAALVRITRSGESEAEISRRIRAWLAKERRDVYLDLGLDGPSIGMAKDIAALLAKTFPGKG